MAKTLLRNNSQSPITLPPPYTGIIAPGDAVVINAPTSEVVAALRLVPELIAFLTAAQVPDSQPTDGFGSEQAAHNIATALASLAEPLDLNGQRIVNLADPIDQQDAATKQYVDLHAGGGSGTVQQVNSGTGLTGGPITTVGTLAVDFGDAAGKVVEGTNPRLVSTAPSTAGGVVYDSGTAYAKTAAGAVGEVLKVGAGGLPEWAVDSTAPSGPAGGSLAGTYPNPTIAAGAISNTEVAVGAAIATSKLSGLVTDIAGNGLAAFLNSGTKVARTYYVAVNGSDGPTADGSISAPFASLQKAHDVAATDYPGSEFVAIEVGPGVFTGALAITRFNTLIQGNGHRAEMQSTQVLGAISVNPATATQKYNHLVGLAGMYINPGSGSTAAAVKATGAGLYSLIVNDCYLTTGNAAATANALACDATNASRPRIIINDSILTVQTAGPNIVQLDRGDVRMNNTQIQQGSSIPSGAAGTGVVVANDATLWLNSSLVETQTTGPGISATGTSASAKLILTTSSVTTSYSGAADTSHGITVSNTAGVAAFLWQTTFSVADTSAAVYAINGSAPAVVVYGELSFQPGTNSTIASAITLTPMTEKHGTMNLPSLTASLPLKLDANKNVTAAALSLTGSEVTGTLAVGKGGTGISTTPPSGSVAYGNGTTLAYNTPGTSGQPLLSTGAGTPTFGPLDLAGGATVITGTLPAGNQAAQSVGGDLSGTTAAATVTGIRGRTVDATAPTAGQVYAWSGSAWAPTTLTTGGGGGGGGGLTYYMNYTTAGDAPLPVVGDKELSLVYDTGAQVNTGAIEAPNGSYATLAEFVTDLNQPGATTIAPGNWDIAGYMALSGGTDGTFMRARVFKWDGTTLTELSTSPSDDVALPASGIPELVTASVYIQQAVLTATDRIVIRIEIKRNVAGTRYVTGYFNGNTPSHVHSTLGAPGGTGVVKVVSGIVQSPATLIFNSDVDAAAAILVTKLDGVTGGGSTSTVLHGGATPSWGKVALGSDVSGQLGVGNGGTGLASGTAGGVLYFSSTSTLASTGALTANALMLGGGASGPTTLGSLGTSTQVLKGNASGAPTWGALSLSTDSLSGQLPIANGGTNGTSIPTAGAVAYGTGTAYAFTAAGTAGQVLTSGGIGVPQWVTTLGYAAGGTGNSSAPTLYGVAYGDGTKIVYTPAGSVGQVLTVGAGGGLEWGTNSADPTGPAYGDLSGNFPSPTVAKINGATVTTAGGALVTGRVLQVTGVSTVDYAAVQLGLAAAVSGTLPAGNGGTGNNATPTLGTLPYGDGTKLALLAAGTSGQYLKSNGAASPSWTTLNVTDLTGTLPTGNGGTGQNTYTAGDMLYYASGTAMTKLAISATSGALLSSTGTAPSWNTSLLVTSSSVTINQKPLVHKPTVQSLTADTDTISAGTIPPSYMQLSATATRTLTSTPSIYSTGVAAGTSLTLVNTGTNPIILRDESVFAGSGIQLGGVTSRALNQYTSINLIFDGTYWIESAIGGSGSVQSVTAPANSLITISGTTENPSVGISGLTGANPGTSGGVPYFNAANTLASSALLANNQLMMGGGAGAAPKTLGSWGNSGQPLLGGGVGVAPAFGALNIATSAVTGTLPVGKGGTGTAVTPTQYGVIYADTTSSFASTAAGTTGQFLKAVTSGAPIWGAINLASDVGATVLPIANGGTGNGSTVTANTVFAGPTSGGAGAPSYRALVAADMPTGIPAANVTGIPYDIAGSAAGTPSPSSKIFYFKAVRACTIASSGHQGGCGGNPGATTTFTVKVAGSSIGTFTIDASGVFAASLAQTAVSVGQLVTVETDVALNGITDPYFTFAATLT